MKEYRYAGRKNLSSRKCSGRQIDMEYVYGENDRGRTIQEIAAELGVSRSTLRRHHIKYQEEAKFMQDKRDSFIRDGEMKESPFANLEG